MNTQYLNHAFAATAALALGLGFSFWQSTGENGRLREANLTATIALEAAQDEAKGLRDRLSQETRELHRAEASQAKAEASEKALSGKLMAAMKALQTAEAARADAEAKLETFKVKFEEADRARSLAEGERDDASAKLLEAQSSHQAIQSARHNAAAAASLIAGKLERELRAIRSAEAALDAAQEEVRTLAALAEGEEPKLCKAMPELPVKISKSMERTPSGIDDQSPAENVSSRPQGSASAASSQTDVLLSADGTPKAELSVQ